MEIGVASDHLGNLTSPCPNYPHLAMTLHDHGHPIIAHPYNLTKIKDIDLKLSGYVHRGRLISFREPNLTWSNLPSYHPIIAHPYNLTKIKILIGNFQDEIIGEPNLTWSKLTSLSHDLI